MGVGLAAAGLAIGGSELAFIGVEALATGALVPGGVLLVGGALLIGGAFYIVHHYG